MRLAGMEELRRTLPGGPRPGCSAQGLLRNAIAYIQFLQRRIWDTQNTLVPHSAQLGFCPLWTPRAAPSRGAPPAGRPRRGHPAVRAERPVPEPPLRQRLVPYLSSSSSDSGDAGPWLVSVAMSPRSPHSPCTPQSLAPPFLGLSPSLQTPPAGDVTAPPVLFEEVQLGCESPPQESGASATLSLDHSYQSQSSARMPGQPMGRQQQQGGVCIEEAESRPGLATNRRAPRGRGRGKVPPLPAHIPAPAVQAPPSQNPGPFRVRQNRKKCVNGFIMFCRLNRRPYLRANPGKASTAATRELAELWRVMSAQERQPYCMQALQFSVQHDRLVKPRSAAILPGGVAMPIPLCELLAEKQAPPLHT